MKLSEILQNGNTGDSEFFGVELDTCATGDISFIKRISFVADLNEEMMVETDFLYRLSIWITNAFSTRTETLVEIPHESKSDITTVVYGVSSIGASAVIMPPANTENKNELINYVEKLKTIGELSFTKSFQQPVQPISGYLSKLMADAYSGEETSYDHYLESIFTGVSGFLSCDNEVKQIVDSLIRKHIGDQKAFAVFTKQVIDQVAVEIKSLADEHMIVVD
ncbi:hypothetical protein [Photobacterium damselae]|uniref:hypothetical protein n=1 Tax=Photobacterium damselae TaxID=38293 RepID=UPI00406867AF